MNEFVRTLADGQALLTALAGRYLSEMEQTFTSWFDQMGRTSQVTLTDLQASGGSSWQSAFSLVTQPTGFYVVLVGVALWWCLRR
jgi:hypothetical protein